MSVNQDQANPSIAHTMFHLLYYTQLQIVFMAVLITMLVQAFLIGKISWQATLLVGLGTYFTYSIDNLFDWGKDKQNYPEEKFLIQRYHLISYVFLGLSAVGIVLLLLGSPARFKIGVLLLGGIAAIATARFATYRSLKKSRPEASLTFYLNRLFITTVWVCVCIFLPLWMTKSPVTVETWRVFAYMWLQIFCYAVLWRLEKTPSPLREKIVTSKLPLVLQIFCILAALLVVYMVIFGTAEALALVHILIPITSIFLVRWALLTDYSTRKAISLLFLIQALLILIITALFLNI